ncbi:MAG: hypothetical protein A2W80_13720 [Candidatus Riflebacteria bacterium GWC2_50_8]|nr:MAG: hypothetical protein A2W80_13720 [Candidatus Riflebacteria bacterium GWC2_50_8]
MKLRAAKKYLKKQISQLKSGANDRAECKTACCIDCNGICVGLCYEAYLFANGFETSCPLLQSKQQLETIMRIQRMRKSVP